MNGLIEQWGMVTTTPGSNPHTVDLYINCSNYIVQCITTGNYNPRSFGIHSKNTANFSVMIWYMDSSYLSTFDWFVIGY